MKKLIAISVVFALVAGAVFAADIAVDVKGGVNLIKGDTGKDGNDADGKALLTAKPAATPTTVAHKPQADGTMGQFRISASGENDDGTFGAFFRYDADGGWSKNVGSAQGHAWWKPVDALKILIGGGPDGRFEKPGVGGWNFYQVAGDVGVAKENWKFGNSFYGGWGDAGLDLIITPIEPLEINIAIPFISEAMKKGSTKDDPNKDVTDVQNVYMKSTLQVAYNIENIGSFAITYASDVGNKAKVDPTAYTQFADTEYEPDGFDATGAYPVQKFKAVTGKNAGDEEGFNGKGVTMNTGKLWLYFNLTAIENLSIDIGFGYRLPQSKEKYSHNYPIAAGVAAKFDAGDFGVKARLQGLFAEKEVINDKAHNLPINVVFDVQPYYAVSEALAVHFSVGVDYTAKDNTEGYRDASYAKMGFHVNPYVTIKSSWWAPNFYAGILVYTDGTKYKDGVNGIKNPANNKDGTSVINWAVPLGIAFQF